MGGSRASSRAGPQWEMTEEKEELFLPLFPLSAALFAPKLIASNSRGKKRVAGASIREINREVSAGGGKGIKLRGSELEEERNKTHPRAKKALRRRKKKHILE